MRNNKKILLILIVITMIFSINLPTKKTYNNEAVMTEQNSTSTDDGIMTVADPIGIVTSDFATLKHYLQLNDGNEYHLHLQNDIAVTETINVVGVKAIQFLGYALINQFGGSEMLNVSVGATLNLWNGTLNGSNHSSSASSNVVVNGTLNVENSNFVNGTQGIHVGSSGTVNFLSGSAYYNSSYGIAAYGKVNFSGGDIYSSVEGIHLNGGSATITGGSVHDNTYGIGFHNGASGTIAGLNVYSNDHGIVVDTSSSAQMSSGSSYGNSINGVVVDTATFKLSGGNIYNNPTGINNKTSATTTVSGGTIYSNTIGIRNDNVLTVTSGTFKTNTATNGSAIYQNGTCTITGGSFAADQNIYLAASNKFVTTNTSYPTFAIKPNTYTRSRVLVKTSGNTYANNEISNVTLYPNSNWYTRVSGSNIVLWDKTKVITKYQDSEGNTLADDVVTEDWAEATYTTSAKDIEGYILTSTPSNATGTYAATNTEVIYVYEADTTAQVEVIYTNQESGEILEKITLEGIVGDSYTTEAKIIDGYELVVTPDNATGTMTKDIITVTYEYVPSKGSITVTEVDKSDNTIVLSGATIKLERLDDEGNIDTTFTVLELTTDETGIVNFTELSIGKYRLTQIVSPLGYQLRSKSADIEITTENRDLEITWESSKNLELPKTGSINWSIFIYIIGFAVILVSIIFNNKLKRN